MLMTYFMLFAGKRNIYRFFFQLSLLLLASELGGFFFFRNLQLNLSVVHVLYPVRAIQKG